MNSRRLPAPAGLLFVLGLAAVALLPTSRLLAQASAADVEQRDSDGQTALHKYTVYDWGSLEDVKTLVARGANLNAPDNDGYTPLHLAAMSGFTDKALFLIEQGADRHALTKGGSLPLHLAADRRRTDPALLDLLSGPRQEGLVNRRDGEGRTPLFRAVDMDNTEAVKKLLELGGDPNLPTTRGEPPIARALLLGYRSVAQALAAGGARADAPAEDGMTVLMRAMWRDKPDDVAFLLTLPFDAKARSQGNRTALHMAALKALQPAATTLLGAGADINAAADDGRTPLDFVDEAKHPQFAAWFKNLGAKPGVKRVEPKPADDTPDEETNPLLAAIGKEDLAAVKKVIAEKPALVNQVGDEGGTALMIAVKAHWLECMDTLVAAGANLQAVDEGGSNLAFFAAGDVESLKWVAAKGLPVDQPNARGSTPLILAAGMGVQSVQWLLDHGASIKARSQSGETVMTRALAADNLKIFRLLIEKGADLSVRDTSDATLLHRAARLKNPEFARFLLEKNAALNATDKTGRTPLHRAAESRSAIETLKLLLEKGADRSVKDVSGKTPLDYATKAKNKAALELLQ